MEETIGESTPTERESKPDERGWQKERGRPGEDGEENEPGGQGEESDRGDDSQPSVRRSARGLIVVTALFALGVAAAAMFRAWGSGRDSGGDLEARKAAVAAPVDVAVITDEQASQIFVEAVAERKLDLEREITGKVAFNEERTTPVFSPYAGRVIELNAGKGAVVKAGQPLLTIESPDLVAAQNDLATARSDEAKSRIALDAAQKAAERARNLHEREALSTKDLQQAEADLARARDELRRCQAALAYAESRLTFFGKNAGQLVEAGGAGGPDRRVVIRAPISGVIVERKVGGGQYVRPDMPDPLFLISDLSTVWVMADVYEGYLANIRVGQPVEIAVLAYPDRRFPARVSLIDPIVDPVTRTVHVRCSAPNPRGLLKPDMFARVNIGAAKPVLAVPTGAVFTRGANLFVFVEEAPKRFRRRPVEIGREVRGFTVIASGLQEGERVATRGVLLLDRIAESGGK